jgi:hypothetical protein
LKWGDKNNCYVVWYFFKTGADGSAGSVYIFLPGRAEKIGHILQKNIRSQAGLI